MEYRLVGGFESAATWIDYIAALSRSVPVCASPYRVANYLTVAPLKYGPTWLNKARACIIVSTNMF
jgi:hypothetical protein